jgi:hypothetical protein
VDIIEKDDAAATGSREPTSHRGVVEMDERIGRK